MKKYSFFAIVIAMVTTFMMYSCGNAKSSDETKDDENREIVIKGDDGKIYGSYREACREGDFAAAHKFLDKLKEESDDYKSRRKVYEAEDYIYKQEALFLMSQNDDSAKKRLIYLIKEEERGEELVELILDIAIDEKDEKFVKVLADQLTDDVSNDCLNKLATFLFSTNNSENIDFVFYLYEKLEKSDVLLEKAITKLHIDRNNTELSNKVLGLLGVFENRIPTRPALGTIKSKVFGGLDNNYTKYISAVKEYNDACRNILNIAIKSKNNYLAQRVISKPKQNIEYKDLGDWETVVVKSTNSSAYSAYRVTMSSDDIRSIKVAYQDAVRSGAFK